MKRSILSLACAASLLCATAQQQDIPLSLEQAAELVEGNRSMQLAAQQVAWAENERRRLNAFWYPNLTAGGGYVHMANPIEVKESLSAFTDPLKRFIHTIDPGEQLISSLLDRIGRHSFGVPLAPPDVATVDATATLPLFTGGKRIYGSRIGKAFVEIARTARQEVGAAQQVLLVETYYGLRLGRQIVEVKRQTLEAFELHYRNALKLEAQGMLTRTERLVFQVNRDEARRALETAVSELEVTEQTFKTLVGIESDRRIVPTSPLFIHESLPSRDYFRAQAGPNNYLVRGLEIQQEVQKNRLRIANAAYLPEIGVFWKQTIYSHGIRKNLVPRWLVGVGFTWNLFDGLQRERKIGQAQIASRSLETERAKAADDIALAVDRFYSQIRTALDNVAALRTTLRLSREIVRARKKSFLEGMATTAEVVDAELLLAQSRIAVLTAYYQFDTGLINLLSVCGMPEAFVHYGMSGSDEGTTLREETATE